MARITNPKVTAIEIVMPLEAKERLLELADERSTNMSEIVRKALEMYTASLQRPIEFRVDPRKSA